MKLGVTLTCCQPNKIFTATNKTTTIWLAKRQCPQKLKQTPQILLRETVVQGRTESIPHIWLGKVPVFLQHLN